MIAINYDLRNFLAMKEDTINYYKGYDLDSLWVSFCRVIFDINIEEISSLILTFW